MIIRRFATALRKQNWEAAFLDFVIVVAGLFIGLELNNWSNELANERQLETYFEQLIIDLEADLATARSTRQRADQNSKMGELVHQMVNGADVSDFSDTEIARAIAIAGFTDRPTITRHTYEEMMNTGVFSLIKDTNLKRKIRNYYTSIEDLRQWDTLIQHEQIRYRDAVRGVLTLAQMRWIRDWGETPPPDFDRAYFLDSLKGRQEIAASVASLSAEQQRLHNHGLRIEANAQNLIQAIHRPDTP